MLLPFHILFLSHGVMHFTLQNNDAAMLTQPQNKNTFSFFYYDDDLSSHIPLHNKKYLWIHICRYIV